MSDATVISVNPSTPTEGALHPEATARGARLILRAPSFAIAAPRRLLAFLLGCDSSWSTARSLGAAATRLVAATYLVCQGVMLDSTISIAAYGLAGMIFLGLLCRWSALTAGIYLGVTTGMAFAAGHLTVESFPAFSSLLAMVCIATAISGSGGISIDQAISNMIMRIWRKTKKRKQHQVRIPFSYQAYRYTRR